MTRACVLLLLLTGCADDGPAPLPPLPPAPVARAALPPPPALPDAPVVIDRADDAIVVRTTGVHGGPDEDGELDAADEPPDTSAGDVPDVQDRCPDLLDEDDGGDRDGCPEPAPAA